MVEYFQGTLKLPMAIYVLDCSFFVVGARCLSVGRTCVLDYNLPMLQMMHWKVSEGPDTFAFRHPSLALPDVCQLLDSEAHHHKVCPIGTGRLIASVGVSRPKM